MRTVIVFVSLLVTSAFCYAQNDSSRLSATIYTGFHQQEFDWSIAGDGNGENPNIYSELIWKKLRGLRLGGDILWEPYPRVVLQGSFDYTRISSGVITDSDYASDNRQDRTFYMLLDAGRGSIVNLNPTIGYRIITSSRFNLVAAAGFSLSKQSLFIFDDDAPNNLVYATYDSRWNGGLVELSGNFFPDSKFSLDINVRYKQLNFDGEGNWKLIDTFKHPVSFRQEAKGYAIEFGSRLEYRMTKALSITYGGAIGYWQTGAGIDTLYKTDGTNPRTQFNGATRKDCSVNLGLTYSFH